jgi:NifB/MoaA-like Fe-S oxidoreductase
VTVATGELFAPVLRRLLRAAALAPPASPAIEVVAVRNEFFGPAISVAGLLTGQDLARALDGRALGELVLIPGVALHEGRGVLLDDVSPDDLAAHLGVRVEAPEPTAQGLLAALVDPRPARPAPERSRTL